MTNILTCHEISKSFKDGRIVQHVLDKVNFSVSYGNIIGISGNSGSGKTTLLNIIGMLDLPTNGKVYYNDICVTDIGSRARSRIRNKTIGFIFQEFFLIREFSVIENVMMPALNTLSFLTWRTKKAQLKKRAQELLDTVGIGNKTHANVRQLSGGEKQRVAIARALIQSPDLVLCDEPTGNLDEETEAGIRDLFLTLNKEHNTTFLIVSHNQTLLNICSKTYKLSLGKLTEIQ